MNDDVAHYRERARRAREWFYGERIEPQPARMTQEDLRAMLQAAWKPPRLMKRLQRLLRTKLSGPVPDSVHAERNAKCRGCRYVRTMGEAMLCGRCGCPAEMYAALNDVTVKGKLWQGKNRKAGHACPAGLFGVWQPWWRTAWVLIQHPEIAAVGLREIGSICFAQLRSRGWIERPSKVVRNYFAAV